MGVKQCVAMCNGTIALEIAIRALELRGEVIVPSYTFIATAHALQWQEITPVFADIDPHTHNRSGSRRGAGGCWSWRSGIWLPVDDRFDSTSLGSRKPNPHDVFRSDTMQVQRLIETVTSPRLVIDLPGSFVNHRVEVLVVTLDESESVPLHKRRMPPPQFAGKVRELGDVMSSVPPADWGITE